MFIEEELAAATGTSSKPGLDRAISVASGRERALSMSSNASKPAGEEEEEVGRCCSV